MTISVTLLANKADNSYGEPVALDGFINTATYFVMPDALYSASGPIQVSIEVANDDAGPWKSLGTFATIETADAGKLLSGRINPLDSNLFIPYVRAKLSASPGAGSVTVKAYAREL